MAASNERVFFAPCKDASICSISTIASTTDPEQTLLSETVPKRIFVDGAVLYFSDTEKTYRCNFAACTPERIGSGPLLAFARSSTEAFLSFADQLVRVPRTPLRSF
ncbi:MAG: hypothetical protein EOP08_01375 [Proteobacteria bacterium]|nr:MAG: hypothetical protein EOP08_01375 [Pseudomonadota bacterium]